MLHMLRLTVILFVLFWSLPGFSKPERDKSLPITGKDIPGVDMEKMQRDINRLLEEVQKNMSVTKPPLLTQQQIADGQKAADKAMESFNSKENKKKLQEERTRIQKWNERKPGVPLFIQPQEAPLQSNDSRNKVYVFLSSSMPDEAVNTYVRQAALGGGSRIVPVFYGFPGGLANKQAAGSYFARMLKEDLECKDRSGQPCPRVKIGMKVNPILFQRYGVTRVPEVVYTNGENSWTLGGDASLGFILEKINSEARSPFLDQAIKKIRGRE